MLAVATAFGVEHLFLIPQQNADKVADKASKEVYGDLGTAMETEEGLALLGDPATLPDSTTKEGTDLINALLQFTQRVMTAALAEGFVAVEGATWNENVEALANWLKIEEPVAEAVVETPTAEQVAEPLTAKQATEVAEAVAEDVDTVETARELVTASVGEVVTSNMSDEQIVETALGLGLMKAQETAAALTDSAAGDIQEATTNFVNAITGALRKMGASSAIQHSTIASIKASLPATVEVETVA